MSLSTAQAAAEVLYQAARPLTITEITQSIQSMGAARTAKPEATVRSALLANSLIATLGGRPAQYVWWPNLLPGCSFRQPLALMDFETGELPLTVEVWTALWPDFYAKRGTTTDVTIEIPNGPSLVTTIKHLRLNKPIWGIAGELQLAEWCRAVGATPEDDLILNVLDVPARHYRMSLQRRSSQEAGELHTRNDQLLQAAMDVVTASHNGLRLHSELVPRLVARGFYRSPMPPGPLGPLLRSSLRFLVSNFSHVDLVARLVMQNEGERREYFGSYPPDRPQGDWLMAEDEDDRRTWGEYLFEQGMEFHWGGHNAMAEAYYRAALMVDPGHADAWVHVGNIRFDEGLLAEALQNYLTAEAVALERTIGDPSTYAHPFWLDLDSRPYLRALHGKGLTLWRMGRGNEAAAVFRQQLELNPDDNQGVRFMLPDLEAGLTWEESVANFEKSEQSRLEGDADE